MFLPILTIAALAACNAPAPEDKARDDVDASTPPAALDPPSAGTSAEGLNWTLKDDGRRLILAYEAAGSGDGQLTLSCRPRGRTLRLSRESGPDEAAEFRLASGDARTVYPGEVKPSEISAGTLEGVAPAAAPVFVAFRSSGELIQTINGEEQRMVASPEARARVDQFFAACVPGT